VANCPLDAYTGPDTFMKLVCNFEARVARVKFQEHQETRLFAPVPMGLAA
jgi:ribosomal protein RSM22 (predicted rRNA methylase)